MMNGKIASSLTANRWITLIIIATYAIFGGMSFQLYHAYSLVALAANDYPLDWIYLLDIAYIAFTVLLVLLLLGWLLRTINQFESELAQREERYRRLVDTTPDLVWETNAAFDYTFVSSVARALLGCSPAELIGKTPFDIMPEQDAGMMLALFRQCAAGGRQIRGIDLQYHRRDGGTVPVEMNMVPILAADGTLHGFQGIDRDITERKKTEAMITRTTKYYKELFDNFPLPIWRSDASGKIVYHNEMALDYIGDPSHGCRIHPEDIARYLLEFEKAVAAYASFSLSYRIQRLDGDFKSITHVGNPCFESNGAYIGHVGYFLDLDSSPLPAARSVDRPIRAF